MRNAGLACAGLLVLGGLWRSHAEDKPPATQPAGAAASSQWSAPSEEGLQTRLVSITKSVRPGKPLFIQMEVRHKDGKAWAQATPVGEYAAEVIVRDNDNKVADSLPVRLIFRTMVPAGGGIAVGVFLAGRSSAALRAGTYTVSIEPRVPEELLKRGAVRLPVAGPLGFEVPGGSDAVTSDSTLKPDYEQAEEIRVYMQARGLGYPPELLEQGKSVSPGLVALVEKGDDRFGDGHGLLQWQYAAFLLGEIGDRRAAPFLLKRLDDKEAMSFYFVQPLGKLGVKQAVPRLVLELQTMNDNRWQFPTSAYGTWAACLVEALERITGEKFPKGKDRWPDKETTLKAVNEWWAKQDAKAYALPDAPPATAAPER